MTRATIYLRQSEDKTGDEAAVSRQLADCRALCDSRGWTIVDTFTDNDISATTGKRRPGFEALLASKPQRIVVWHIDRLVRLSRELERVLALGVNVHAVKSGHIDLSNPAGRATARTVTAWAQYEGEHKAERQVAANMQRAQRGKVLWTRRPFGFERDGADVRIVKAEAAEIRKAARAALKGATLSSIVRDWNGRGLTTTTGSAWTVTSLRRVLLSPRTAGRVVSKGIDYGDGGQAILDRDTADRIKALLSDPARRSSPSVTTKYLLSGLVQCGREGCNDATMFATRNARGSIIYRCLSCFGGRLAEPVDEVVQGVLLARLTRPDAAGLLDVDVDVDELRERVVDLRKRRDGLAALLADGLLTPESVRAQAERLAAQISDLERQIETATGASPLARVLDSDDVEAALARLSLLQVREILRTLMTVRILPVGKGVRFQPEHVAIEWKGRP